MESSAVRSAILESVNAAPIQPGFRGAFSVLGRILDAVKVIVAQAIAAVGTLTPETKAAIETEALSVFDAMVVLPEPFDTFSDMAFKSALDKILGV